MNSRDVKERLQRRGTTAFDHYERRPGSFQLIAPIMHEDGDMVEVYLRDSPKGDGYDRVCDFGMTLMRRSYSFDVSTPTRQCIFESIIINNGVVNDDGNLYLDTSLDKLYESVLQFAGCAQKVCNMHYRSRETVRSAFYDDLGSYVDQELVEFNPVRNLFPMVDYPISVDWSLTHNRRDFYLFGLRGNEKAKNVAIALLEFQKVRLPFISLVVHESMEELGSRERLYLTKNTDTQYPLLADFQERATEDIYRFAGLNGTPVA